MLVVGEKEFDAACKALMTASLSAKDTNGLKVMPDIPRGDVRRIRSITLGALVAMLNSAAYPADEMPLSF
jgi:hypothetical protein